MDVQQTTVITQKIKLLKNRRKYPDIRGVREGEDQLLGTYTSTLSRMGVDDNYLRLLH